MDITQLLITVGAVVGIVIVGLLAIVPTVLELPGRDSEPAGPAPTPIRPHAAHPDSLHLAA